MSTHLCLTTPDDILLRGRSLPRELVGKVGFTELMAAQILGRQPTGPQVSVIEACLVTLMEHGMTPTAVTTRLTYTSAPEAMQGAVAAGLLGVGSLFVGTLEGCARHLDRLLAAPDVEAEAAILVAEHRAAGAAIAGFGHPQHRPDDPRSPALFAHARAQGVAGPHLDALLTLSRAVDAALGRHLTINATGAVAALLGDCGVPADIMKGFALVARCAGLVAHIREEQQHPTLRDLWRAAESAVPYRHPADTEDPP